MADLVIKHASELLTIEGNSTKPVTGDRMKQLGIIKDGALAVTGGLIEWVGETNDLKNAVEINSSTRVIDAEKKTVMPGYEMMRFG